MTWGFKLRLNVFVGGIVALYSLLCRNAKVGLLRCDKSANEVVLYEERSGSKLKADSRARRAIEKHKICHYLILFLALFGSCMTIGDAVLTPALSGGLQFQLIFLQVNLLWWNYFSLLLWLFTSVLSFDRRSEIPDRHIDRHM